jgi:hypothetical protein
MRLLILYRQKSEHRRSVEEFIDSYKRRTGSRTSSIEVVDIDSREGIALASLYDIVEYPAILVMQHDGQVQKMWIGDSMPLLDEVSSYINA